jgi:hypothetical protein
MIGQSAPCISAITTGSGAALFWALAALLPIVIHLLSRRRFVQLDWAAMPFLAAAIRKHSRRMRLERLLLLCVRVSIVLVLAAALADISCVSSTDPVGAAADDVATYHVLVLDASYSMNTKKNAATRFDEARARAIDLVKGANQGDGFSVVLLADPPQVVVPGPSFDRDRVIAELALLEAFDGLGDLQSTTDEVLTALEEATQRYPSLGRRRVCFFTDLETTTWRDVESLEVADRLETIAKSAAISMADVGDDSRANLAITRLRQDDAFVVTGRDSSVTAWIRNFGGQDRRGLDITFSVEGRVLHQERIDLPGGATAQVVFQQRFHRPGQYVVRADLSDDVLATDNSRWTVVEARDQLSALCVEGRAGTARELAFALSPVEREKATVQVSRISEAAVWARDLERFDIVCLVNVRDLTPVEAASVHRYVRRGGGLIVFLGDRVDAQNYNQLLGAAAETRVLPASLLEPARVGRYHPDPGDYDHPIADAFRGHVNSGLITMPIWKYQRLEAIPHADAITAVKLDNGDPLIIFEPIGLGMTTLVATAASMQSVDDSTLPATPWTAMSSWHSFVPLVQEMVALKMSRRQKATDATVGDSLIVDDREFQAAPVVRFELPHEAVQRIHPEGSGNASQFVLSRTRHAGVYHASPDEATRPQKSFAVNVGLQESRLTRLPVDQLPPSFNEAETDAEAAEASGDTDTGRSWARYLLVGLLLLVLLESVLAWRFGGGNEP